MGENELYPIFLKVTHLQILIVGGGNVAFEKLFLLLKSSPSTKVQLVAPHFTDKIHNLSKYYKVSLIKQIYTIDHLLDKRIVIAATNNEKVNRQIYHDAKKNNILVNVADNPSFCDFYLGGIVNKGNVKIGISTNGKSPITAKRLRQFLEEVIPDEIDDLVNNLNRYKTKLKDDFSNKVSTLNHLTRILINK